MKEEYYQLLAKLDYLRHLLYIRFFTLTIYLILMLAILRLTPKIGAIESKEYDSYSRVIILFMILNVTDNDNSIKYLLRSDILILIQKIYSQNTRLFKVVFENVSDNFAFNSVMCLKLILFFVCAFHLYNFELLIIIISIIEFFNALVYLRKYLMILYLLREDNSVKKHYLGHGLETLILSMASSYFARQFSPKSAEAITKEMMEFNLNHSVLILDDD